MTAIVRRERGYDWREQYMFAMYLLWATRPKQAAPDDSGAYYIGDCGECREGLLDRPTPYSICTGRRQDGYSTLELLLCVAIVLIVSAIGIPLLWGAMQTVRGLMELVRLTVPYAN